MKNQIILNHKVYFSSYPVKLEEVVGYIVDDILKAGTRNLVVKISAEEVLIASSHDWVFAAQSNDVTLFDKFTVKDGGPAGFNQYRSEYIVNSVSEKLIYEGDGGAYKKGLAELPQHIQALIESAAFGGVMYFVPSHLLKWASVD